MIDKISINNQIMDIQGYSTNEAYVNALGGQKLKTNCKRLFGNTEATLIEDGDDIVYGGRPAVPQTGTWQLKQTTDKKYVIVGTDDDDYANTKYYRLCRTYGIPYTMNVTADKLSRVIGTDVNGTNESTGQAFNEFTEADASAVFPTNVTLAEMCNYMSQHPEDCEVALHGASENALCDTTNADWDSLYASYISGGGTKTLEEFKSALLANVAHKDVAQGASYVEWEREAIEQACDGRYIDTCGCWGGTPSGVVDDITIGLPGGNHTYPWREKNWQAAAPYISNFYCYQDPHSLSRMSIGIGGMLTDASANIDKIPVGHCCEYFDHTPLRTYTVAEIREVFTALKAKETSGEIKLVTRKQWYDLGEWVSNPVVSISVQRDAQNIPLNSSDNKSHYTVIATYADSTNADVTAEAIATVIEDTSAVKAVNVYAYYRGFTASCIVSVGGAIVEPTIIDNVRVNTTSLTQKNGGKTTMYAVTAGQTYYLNTKDRINWYWAFGDGGTTVGTPLSGYVNQYGAQSNTAVIVPVGVTHFYVYGGSWESSPWTLSTTQLQ